MKRLKFKFQDEKQNIQFQLTESRQTLRNATTDFFKAKKLFNEVSGKQKKKIQFDIYSPPLTFIVAPFT